MSVSSKCYYALRAIYALAGHAGPEPMKIAEIAEKEQIPIRFLEVILNQLKGGGFVQSRRGAEGGYRLARPSDQITIGEVLKFVEEGKKAKRVTPDAFTDIWKRVDLAISGVLDRTTFAELVRRWKEMQTRYVPNWEI